MGNLDEGCAMRVVVLALVGLTLAGCAGFDRPLRDLDASSDCPDEFSVVPSAPLELPTDLSLPVPTPGASNRTDVNPVGAAVAALGGRPNAAGGVPAADAGLVTFASRNGVAPEIRSLLAAEDARVRERAGRLRFNPFSGGDRYFRAYARQALDAYAELERFRAAGVATPSAPSR